MSIYRLLSSSIIALLVFSSIISCKSPPETEPIHWPTQEWQIALPEEQGMDSAQLAQMFKYIQENDIRLHSLLIVRNDYLVVEAYYHPYGPGDRHSIESNTKAIIGTLIGMAIDQGTIKSVNQKVVDFFPERKILNMDESKKAITLGDLLSMTLGLDCQDRTPQADGMYQSDSWVQYLLDLPMTSAPGSKWIYCSGAAHLLSAVLQQTTGIDARTYANQYLFEPLGISPAEEKDWAADSEGVTNGIAGLYLTPRDLAKYGYLYLKRGKWEGRQVVSARWVEESTREQAYIGKDDYVGGLDRRFGYLWSIFPEQKYYGYLGMAGQELYVLPEKSMVIVFTGSLEVGREAILLRLVNDYVVPSVRSSSIQPNPQAYSQLQSFIQAAVGSKQPIPALPQTALDITGKTYTLGHNHLGWRDMAFYFQPGSDEAVLKMTGSPDLRIGLDNRYRLTEVPNSRPVGLRGRWDRPDEFYLNHIILGDIIESDGRIRFEEDQMELTIKNLNLGTPPLILYGRASK